MCDLFGSFPSPIKKVKTIEPKEQNIAHQVWGGVSIIQPTRLQSRSTKKAGLRSFHPGKGFNSVMRSLLMVQEVNGSCMLWWSSCCCKNWIGCWVGVRQQQETLPIWKCRYRANLSSSQESIIKACDITLLVRQSKLCFYILEKAVSWPHIILPLTQEIDFCD